MLESLSILQIALGLSLLVLERLLLAEVLHVDLHLPTVAELSQHFSFLIHSLPSELLVELLMVGLAAAG